LIINDSAWTLWTLTAGAQAADGTHVVPVDFDAITNVKHWFKTNSGTISNDNTLIDDAGNTLVDDAGNALSYSISS
jgi:hypothetical protein